MESKLKILVADDASAVRRIFYDAARRAEWPMEIVEASNGKECLHLLSKGDVQLAFIDVHMPEMSGLEALWDARSQGVDAFVTLMSGSDNTRFIEVARELRAYDFLFKPFDVAEIEAIIYTYIRRTQLTRVLVVDDSQAIRRTIHNVLKRAHFNIEVEEASDGRAAIDRCLFKPFDLVFLDYRMPGLNGIETLRELLEHRPMLKVVMVTGNAYPDRESEALKLGAVGVLHKPFYPRDVDAALDDIFELRGPKVLTIGAEAMADFDVAISGSRMAVIHKTSGHMFQYRWYRSVPYLRDGQLRENINSRIAARELSADAENAGLMELERLRLLIR
ncbi:MAG: response regulator [Pseudorhodoplanes sp.]|jgi:DNA-binding NtrC family response regulator|nr:response regulator [Pseudorhodoplanes sp.]